MITEVKQELSETMFQKENDYLQFEDMYPDLSAMTQKPAMQGFWNESSENNNFTPNTPVTPTIFNQNGPIDAKSGQVEQKEPEYQQYLSPEEMLFADDMELFDDQTCPPISSWEPLFLNDSISCPEDVKGYSAIEVAPTEQQQESQQTVVEESVNKPEVMATPNYTPSPYIQNSMSPYSEHSSPYDASPALSTVSSPGMIHKASTISSPGMIQKASTVSPRSREIKLDDLGITAYKRKPRAAPLKPVEVPTDATGVDAKRAKNTEAARRSRARKLERMSQLEERVRSLLDENEALRAEIAQLKNQG